MVHVSSNDADFILKLLDVPEGSVETVILSDMASGIQPVLLRTNLMLVLEAGYFGNRLLCMEFNHIVCRSKYSLLYRLAQGSLLVRWSFNFRYIYHLVSYQRAKYAKLRWHQQVSFNLDSLQDSSHECGLHQQTTQVVLSRKILLGYVRNYDLAFIKVYHNSVLEVQLGALGSHSSLCDRR